MQVLNMLPRTVDALTANWLTQALRQMRPEIEVVSAVVEKVIWGTATKVLMSVEYGNISVADGPPSQLCVKGEFDERVRDALHISITGTQMEASFFNDLAPLLNIPLPRHWYSGSEPGMGIIVLDNLQSRGFSFGTPTDPWSEDMVAAGLDVLARLHSSTWNKDLSHIAWLKVGSLAVREAHEFLMSEENWNKQLLSMTSYLPKELYDRARCLDALRTLWRHDDRVACCVIHGDAHLGNTCIDTEGNPFFIDWAGPCISSWAFDVSYFIVGSMTIANRRASERMLMEHYLDRLAAHGGPVLDYEDAWREYRRHHLPGMVWATLPPELQSVDNVRAMGERFTTAIMDHDTLGALEQCRYD